MSMPPPGPEPESIQALRDAVRVSPQNGPLRLHLADQLLAMARATEAEKEYREALALLPDNLAVQFGLARAFYAQGKNSHALALIETVVKSSKSPAAALILHARLLVGIGEIPAAIDQYQTAVERDPQLADEEFETRLGIQADVSESDEVVEGKVRATWQEEDLGPETELERPRITFKDVGGMEELKEEIRLKIIHPLTHQELYKSYGKTIGGGILLYGPPGCGKTHLARATAGEIGAGFLSIGIHDVLDMWIGNSERNLHQLFEQARGNRPSVLFFDEVDALGASRSDMRQSAGRHLINQFLLELDGSKSSNEGVLVLGATNAPWHLDAAFRRPGRFDRILFVPPPDLEARAAILQLHCDGKPTDGIDYLSLAKKTDGFSGADLKAVVDLTVENKLRDAMRNGIATPLRTKDFAQAVSSLKPTTREWFATARNYALYSNQGGIYDDILKYLKL